jgi:hypothetical protein
VSEPRQGYLFGPLERRGLLGPVRAGQAATLSLATLAAVAVIDSSPGPAGAVLAPGLLIAGAAAAFAPLAGRTPLDWLAVAVAFGARRARGRGRFRSPVPGAGARARVGSSIGASPQPPDAVAPAALRGVRIAAADYGGRAIGVLTERAGRRQTAVLACRVNAFALLDPETQERRLAQWGLVLSGAAGTAIRRLQWIERTAPARGDELARWLHEERDPALAPRGTPIVESYLELISAGARVAQEHEVLLAVQVDAQRIRERGGAVARSLLEQTERVAQGLEAAEVTVLGALSPGQLARTLRTAFDPYARAELATLAGADPERDGLDEVNAWPLGAREAWEHHRSDGALHATYWIAGWPRVEVGPMFMDSLLGRSQAVRTVAVVFEPLATDRSTREIEAAVTRDQADRELRARFGQSETARQRQAAQATVRREAELAAGHAEVRLSGFVTVSGRDEEELRRAAAEMLEHAAQARLELRLLYGQQAQAFTFTLPLCRGLR